MRRNSWLQKLLYIVIVILGTYLLVKGGGLLAARNRLRESLDERNAQQSLEDAAMRTWATAYTAAVEGKKSPNWFSLWMQQIVPVFSYIVDEETEETESETQEADAEEGELLQETESQDIAAESDIAEKQTDSLYEQESMVHSILAEALPQLSDFNYLISNYYIIDADTSADEELLNAEELLSIDLSIEKDPDVPQILIYHTHSQEAFADSREGEVDDTIVGMGEILADELRDYGYNVIHDTGVYDLVDGVTDRSAAYDYARESIKEILEENPTIEVIIDLHRDGIDGDVEDFTTEIDGEPASRIMFFNGISRDENGENISWLPNANLTENLAFSLQLQVLANAEYPGFTRKIYLQAERFNLHLRARSLLIEAGTQLNTVEEEQNAMAPIADLLQQLLEGY
ncbi:MAG: stage II sporulation protein P [Lachnospiraceae bacterium]|nr:stage II sporulation protein P [Lachnospiraceae bacterium]